MQNAEIELDIDELDPDTLYKLYTYVNKHAENFPEGHQATYVPPPPPPQPEQLKKPKPTQPKPKKNKPMTAEEQEARIQQLQSQIHNFDNPAAFSMQSKLFGESFVVGRSNADVDVVAPSAPGEEESSDDDESSGSESEEE